MGLLMCLCFFIWRSRIPFAKEMLKYCIDTINQVRHLPRCIACANTTSRSSLPRSSRVTSASSSSYAPIDSAACPPYSVQYMWTAFWVATVILTYRSLAPSAAYGLSVYLIFSFYWTAQVIKNVVHMTISGVCASVFFLQGSEYGMPANPTLTASKRYVCTLAALERRV